MSVFDELRSIPAAIVLQHCADTGRSWWGWTPWEWARVCGSSAREFVAAQSLPTDSTVRPFVVAWRFCSAGSGDDRDIVDTPTQRA